MPLSISAAALVPKTKSSDGAPSNDSAKMAATSVPIGAAVDGQANGLSLHQATRAHIRSVVGGSGRPANKKTSKKSVFPSGGMNLFGMGAGNSEFLSNLLDDVAKSAKIQQDSNKGSKRSTIATGPEDSPSKRRRTSSETASDPPAFLDLLWEESWITSLDHLDPKSRAAAASFFGPAVAAPRRAEPAAPSRRSAADVKRPAAAAPKAKIPATVSQSFEDLIEDAAVPTAAAATAVIHHHASVHEEEDHFGWFVEMDEDDEDDDAMKKGDDIHHSHQSTKSSRESLAFQAPTAPKACPSHDAQVQWAMAADTIDDVLGDFF